MDAKPHILVVDDELGPRESLKMILNPYYNVHVAERGLQAIDLLDKFPVDLVTLDLKMPDMDGWSVLTALRADPGLALIPVIVLTIMDDAHLSYTLGAAGYLAKPIDPERLIMMLQPYLRTVLPAPVAVAAEASLSAGQRRPSHERISV